VDAVIESAVRRFFQGKNVRYTANGMKVDFANNSFFNREVRKEREENAQFDPVYSIYYFAAKALQENGHHFDPPSILELYLLS